VVLASIAILGSKSQQTDDHVTLSDASGSLKELLGVINELFHSYGI
jgi:hypothetical protein